MRLSQQYIDAAVNSIRERHNASSRSFHFDVPTVTTSPSDPVSNVGQNITGENARDTGTARFMMEQTAQMYSRSGSPATNNDTGRSAEYEGEVDEEEEAEEDNDDPAPPQTPGLVVPAVFLPQTPGFAIPAGPHPTPIHLFNAMRNSTAYPMLRSAYSTGMSQEHQYKLDEFNCHYHQSILCRQLATVNDLRNSNGLWRRLQLGEYPRLWRKTDWTTTTGNMHWNADYPGLVPDGKALLCLLWRSREVKQIFGRPPSGENEPFLEPAHLVQLILEAIGVPRDHRWAPMRRRTRNLLTKREGVAIKEVLGKDANTGWHDKWDEELAQHRERVTNDLMMKSGRPFLTDADKKVLQHSMSTRIGGMKAGKNGPTIALFETFELSDEDVEEVRRAVATLRIEVL